MTDHQTMLPTDDDATSVLAHDYLTRLRAGDRAGAGQRVLDAVDGGLSIRDVYLDVFQPVLWEVGRLWEMNEMTVAEEHFCTAATQLVMSRLYPRLFGTERSGHRLVATCVGGNLHEIGVRMVSDFFEMDGWDTYYLGADTPREAVVDTVTTREAHVLAVSATMEEHVPQVRELIAALPESREEGRPWVMVGGAPFRTDPSLWRDIGADGFAPDAGEAVLEGRRLLDAA